MAFPSFNIIRSISKLWYSFNNFHDDRRWAGSVVVCIDQLLTEWNAARFVHVRIRLVCQMARTLGWWVQGVQPQVQRRMMVESWDHKMAEIYWKLLKYAEFFVDLAHPGPKGRTEHSTPSWHVCLAPWTHAGLNWINRKKTTQQLQNNKDSFHAFHVHVIIPYTSIYIHIPYTCLIWSKSDLE